MPPSTPALFQTHYTGLNTVLALAYNTPAAEHSQEDFMKNTDLSQEKINRYFRVVESA